MRASLLAGAIAIGGCSFASTGEDWQGQLRPSGPCYAANLLDGVDERSTTELHQVFACVNATGALDAYASLDAALDTETRDGPAGIVVARWVNALPSGDGSLASLLRGGLAVLDDPTGLFDGLHLGLELVYGAPWPWLGSTLPLNSQTSLDNGLLVPLLPTLGGVAGAVLDDDLAPLGPVADALRSDTARRAAWTLASIGTSSDPTLAGFEQNGAANTGDFIARTTESGNDRWPDATGNSLRDVGSVLYTRVSTDGRTRLDHLGDKTAPILADTRLRDSLERVLADQIDAGRVAVLPAQVRTLVSVDSGGGALSPGEDSAFQALVRLIHNGDNEVNCSVDLLLFEFDISLGNLSEELLTTLARQAPSTVDTGVGLLGDLLGVSLTGDLLDAIADSDVCPGIDRALIADLQAIDRLNDPGADELLHVLLAALAAFDDQGQIPALVDTAGAIHTLGLVEPFEELVRDTSDTAGVAALVDFLPVLLDPDAYHDLGAFPAGILPLDFDAAWDAVAGATTPAGDGVSPLGALASPVLAALVRDGTWAALTTLGTLLSEPESLLARSLPWVAALCAADPALGALDTLADTLDNSALVRPLLVLLEADGLRAAVGTTELVAEGPLPFTAKLVKGGTLGILLDTLSLLATLLPEDDAG